MRALRLRKPCASQPSEIQARSSSSSSLSALLRLPTGLAAFFGLRRMPQTEARREREAGQHRKAGRQHHHAARPSGQRCRRRARSAAGRAHRRPRRRARPAAASRSRAAARPRSRRRASRRRSRTSPAVPRGRARDGVISRQPQTAIGSTSAIAAMPNSCISRSATTAPGMPSMLRIGALVAWLSDGSLHRPGRERQRQREREQDQRAAEFAQPAAELLAQRIGEKTEALKAAFDCPHAFRPQAWRFGQ